MPEITTRRKLERVAALLTDETTRTQPLGAELAWLYQQYQRLERKFVRVAYNSDLMQNHLKETREALSLAIQAAEAADIAKDRFIADISHEIRTSLISVLCILGMLDQEEDDPDKKDLLRLALAAGESLQRLTSGILDLSRMDAGKLELFEEDFRLDQLLDRLVGLYAVTACASTLTVRCERAPGVPVELHGDALKLEQILRNLLDNAVKFTPAGDIVLRVERGHATGGATLTFSVADSGIGIAATDLPHIFESYRQGRAAPGRRAGGSGLGLAVSKRLVELLGGELSVASEPMQGSTFSFTIPLTLTAGGAVPEVGPALAPSIDGAQQPTILADRPPLTLLLADDHRLFREMMTTMLEREEGLQVVAGAGTEDDVLTAVRALRPDIVLLDVYLDGANGFELIAPVREASPDTRIVVLTSDDSADSLRRGIDQGVDGYLLKTLPAEDLLHALRDVATGALVLPTALKRRETPPPPAPERPLSPRETEILHLIAAGKSNPEIAIITGTSENTVKTHVRALMEKLGAHNRVLLLAAAARLGLLPAPPS